MRSPALVVLLLTADAAVRAAGAVEIVQVRDPGPEVVRLTDDVVIPGEDRGYLLVLPDGRPRGLVAMFASGRDTSSTSFEIALHGPCVARGLAFACITTGCRIDFFFSDSTMAIADGYVRAIQDRYDIPRGNLFLAGMSLAGTRALRYTLYCRAEGRAPPRAVAICDAPLDMERFWRECAQAESLGFHPAAAAEGAWVTDHLEAHLGGTPDDVPEAYREYSPYSHAAPDGGSAARLAGVAVRAYTEPDVRWWMETRRKDYYAMNAIDAAALVNRLWILGNDEAELITTHGKGVHPDGTRHPHSWSIVDNDELAEWFASFLRE